MDIPPDTLERLADRVEILERRVLALEASKTLERAPSATMREPASPVAAHEGFSLAQAGGAFSVLGKSMLGIAGAYLLRAVAESSSLPRLAIAAVAIVYALMWLVAAARVREDEWFSSTIYTCTSALILAPMLWELTLRFKLLPAPATAFILSIFVIAATALAWKKNQAPVFWVANLTATVAALALAVGKHELIPFIAALLLMALVSEYAAIRNHQRSVRSVTSLAADAGIWALVFIYASPQSARMDYPALSATGLILPGCLLFLIYGASVAVRTLRLGQEISIFETGQAMVAFLLAASSVLYFEPSSGAVTLGLVCFLFSAACYAASFVLKAEGRNFRVFATWAAGLFLAGSLLCLPPFWLAACLGVAAIAAAALSAHIGGLTLRFHSLAFLVTAAIASGLLNYAFNALAGTPPATLGACAGLVSACALICFALGTRGSQESWRQQILQLATTALALFALAASLVEGLLRLVSQGATPDAPHIAFIRTLILCAIAFVLAFSGSRWRRAELTRIAYATLALVAVKLLFEDLRHGRLEFIAASIFFFALTLIAVPWLAHGPKDIKHS
ncbi:MAG: hypothetical protein ABSD72_14655 [Terracidiphilus sp.]|jgi:hypothetical protein